MGNMNRGEKGMIMTEKKGMNMRRDYERDSRSSYSRSKPEYTDERRPVDLGREARPYPTGVNGHAPSYKSSRERSEHFKDDYHEKSRNGEYYRESYDRDKWERREYDRDRRIR